MKSLEAIYDAVAQCVAVKSTDCEFDPHSMRLFIYLNFHFSALMSGQSSVLCSSTQHAMPPGFGVRVPQMMTECLH